MARPRTLIQFTAPGFDRTGSLQQARESSRKWTGERTENAFRECNSIVGDFGDAAWGSGVLRDGAGSSGSGVFGGICASSVAGVRAADLSGRRIRLDAGILGVGRRRRRLLLGAGNLDIGTASGISVDAGLLGLGWRRLRFPRGLLGTGGGILWRN